MKRYLVATAAAAACVPAVIGLAGNASAAPAGSSAADTIAELRSQGYDVRVNGLRNGPVSNCSVGAVRPMSDSALQTVYVDLSCPHEYIDD